LPMMMPFLCSYRCVCWRRAPLCVRIADACSGRWRAALSAAPHTAQLGAVRCCPCVCRFWLAMRWRQQAPQREQICAAALQQKVRSGRVAAARPNSRCRWLQRAKRKRASCSRWRRRQLAFRARRAPRAELASAALASRCSRLLRLPPRWLPARTAGVKSEEHRAMRRRCSTRMQRAVSFCNRRRRLAGRTG
jgi:hypothetical protein